jgi:Fe(3+) dicitrate transport protein
LQLFGLNANRKSVGYRSNRVSNPDTEGTVRDLIVGDFVNWGAEARYLKRYSINDNRSAFDWAKYYQSNNTGLQGPGALVAMQTLMWQAPNFLLWKPIRLYIP